MTTIAFIGLGRMGLPMARNLLRAGFRVVGSDIDPKRLALLAEAGGAVATSPGDAAGRADISLSMIMNDAILRSVALDDTGVLKGARRGHLYCDLSTVSPAASAEVSAAAGATGIGYLCAKVAGSIGLAESAKLTLFASGALADFDRARAAFAAMAATVVHVGEGDAAAYLKLVHSLIVGAYSAMIGEALAFGQKGGLSIDTMVDVLEAGPLGSRQLSLKAPVLKRRLFDDPPSDIDTAAKDVDIILETARKDRVPLPLISAARQVMAFAQATGGGKREIYSVLEAFERLAGIGPPESR
ncbi:MAG: NAD(P)-dependent oxidoreductase [Alphaproteobacteria bacterium]|nr:NAD(P)-dependent oxidoreductase [Alphaproteobacteria bacterium]